MNAIVIQTALALEYKAVINRLLEIRDYTHPITKSIYKVGKYDSNSRRIEVVVGRTNQTNINAGIETERIIHQFNPSHIFFVGVAGGLKDVNIGDIVIGSDVIGYERGKTKKDFLFRPQFGFSSYGLEQQAVNFSQSNVWQDRAAKIVKTKFHSSIKVLAGTIASGEKVIGSKNSTLYEFLRTNCSHALAVEMEGLGFLEACRAYPLIKSLIIRGISDLVDGKENADSAGSQEYASQVASEFLFSLIDFIDIPSSPIKYSAREKLSEILPKLYPAGLRENEIWLRAGGDLCLVNLSTNGKSQWVQALTLIENGGGGNIDFQSLIQEIKKDYHKNESVKNL